MEKEPSPTQQEEENQKERDLEEEFPNKKGDNLMTDGIILDNDKEKVNSELKIRELEEKISELEAEKMRLTEHLQRDHNPFRPPIVHLQNPPPGNASACGMLKDEKTHFLTLHPKEVTCPRCLSKVS